MSAEQRLGMAADVPPGKVVGAGPYAAGNAGGRYFAVTRRCRHLCADLAGGSIDEDGCLVCPAAPLGLRHREPASLLAPITSPCSPRRFVIGAVSVTIAVIGLELGGLLDTRIGERGEALGGIVLVGVGIAIAAGLL